MNNAIYQNIPLELLNRTIGLIGDKLSHSHSPAIHRILGNPNYQLFELTPEQLPDFIQNGGYHAINVTIPYKKDVMQYLDYISPTARLCDSVNTVLRRDGRLLGYNTDFIGLITLFKFYKIAVEGKNCVVLGSGGAGGTAVRVLEHLGAKKVAVVSRLGEYNYDNIDRLSDTEILVNSTPVGLFGRDNSMPIDPIIFPKLYAVVDLIANPYRTELVNRAQSLGIKGVGGDAMLFAQAIAGFALFFDIENDFSSFGRGYADYRTFGGNIILVGMPGSGKTTLGRMVAKTLGMKFVDMDDEIVKKEGRSIPDIFAKEGEGYFREVERSVVGEVCAGIGSVISTGGGVVENPDNIARLRRSGMVFALSRELSNLDVAGRPISQRDGVEELYRRRKPLYDACADHNVKNITPRQCHDVIIDRFYTDCINNSMELSSHTQFV